ncbi:MAG: flagellar protein FlgN [bacterium]|nr:flagellar protein FlgN [bacterium]
MSREELITSLLDVLHEEIVLYRSLVDLLTEEQATLMAADVETLEEIEKRKETIGLRIRLLEETRRGLNDHLKRCIALPEGEVTLTAVIAVSEGAVRNQLSACQAELRGLLASVSSLVKFNERLVGRSLAFLRTAVSIMGSQDQDLAVYGDTGSLVDGQGAPRMVSRKV